MRVAWPAALLLACCSLLAQTTKNTYENSLVLAPLYTGYLTDTDIQFGLRVRDLNTRIGSGRGVLLGFAAFLHMSPQAMKPMLDDVDQIVRRAKANGIVAHVSIVSGFFHDSNDLRGAAIMQDVRNAQWFSDGWIAEPSILTNASQVPAKVWITPSRSARPLRKRMEEAARALGAHLAAQIAKNPDVLVSVSGDAEVEFSYERNIEGGERKLIRAEPVYADYSPFMIEEFGDWLNARYKGDLKTLNRDFKQSFTTWKLRYYDASGPISYSSYLALKEKLPKSGAFFIDGGFDAPRTEKPGDPFWDTWLQFRKQVISNYVRDFATWITTSPDPATKRTIPANRFYSHQIPADFLFGDPKSLRLKTSASYADTALIAPVGSVGVTAFNTFDGTIHKKTGSDALYQKLSKFNWGIFEYNPSIAVKTAKEPSSDVQYYLAELRNLAKYKPHVIVPFAWTNEPNLQGYRIQGRAFEQALKQFVTLRSRTNLP
jgi:hypothetical protein